MTRTLDTVRSNVLDDMARAEKFRMAAIVAATVVEAALFAAAVFLIDWNVRIQVIVFVLFLLAYLVLALGMLALGSHVSRSTLRIVAAIEGASALKAN